MSSTSPSASFQELLRALMDAELPVADLAEPFGSAPPRRLFRFADADGTIGFAGWEEAGEGVALLRSLVVTPTRRGQGWGRRLTAWLLDEAARRGVRDAYILTMTAAGLAERVGFSRLERDQAPRGVRESRQYAGLCPASAVLLHRRLA